MNKYSIHLSLTKAFVYVAKVAELKYLCNIKWMSVCVERRKDLDSSGPG